MTLSRSHTATYAAPFAHESLASWAHMAIISEDVHNEMLLTDTEYVWQPSCAHEHIKTIIPRGLNPTCKYKITTVSQSQKYPGVSLFDNANFHQWLRKIMIQNN